MLDQSLDEVVQIWAVELRFPTIEGTTLWGNGGAPDELDRCLVVDGRLLLFNSDTALAGFIISDSESALITTPGYSKLKEALARGEELEEHTVFDYTALLAVLARPVSTWDRATASEILDVLNMLLDIVRALELPNGRSGSDGYGELLDRLTFLDEGDDIAAALNGIDVEAVTAAVWRDIEDVEARSVVSS
jgi:hypothetical protein